MDQDLILLPELLGGVNTTFQKRKVSHFKSKPLNFPINPYCFYFGPWASPWAIPDLEYMNKAKNTD